MAGDYVFAVEGIDLAAGLRQVPDAVITAARQAVNKAADRARTDSAEEMRRQVAFPAAYLSGPNSRLAVTKRASNADLESIITGRQRPTSLAQFVTRGRPGPRQGGVSVEVRPGSSRTLQRAFLIKLRAGFAGLDTKSNLGLAIRVPAGQSPSRAYKPLQIGPGLFLLFGPSVDQVFKAVAPAVSPATEQFLEDEFNRLLDLNL